MLRSLNTLFHFIMIGETGTEKQEFEIIVLHK